MAIRPRSTRLRTFAKLKQQPLNEAGASQKDQSEPPPWDGNAVIVLSEIDIPTDILPLKRSIRVITATNVGVIKVAMHSLWRGVDWQFPLKLDCQPFHFGPIGWLPFFNRQNDCQTVA